MSSVAAPEQLEQVLALLAEQQPPVVLAGGTDLWPQWTAEGARPPQRVLSLHRVAPLRAIQLDAEAAELSLGATVTHRQLVQHALVREHCPALSAAAATIGAVQIQNRGTLGGNLMNASPAADLPPVLLAAGATVELASAVRGVRRLPLSSFYRGYRQLDHQPDELLLALRVPLLPAGALERFRKVGTRRAQAISKVAGACRIQLSADGQRLQQVGLGFASVGPVPLKLDGVEQWLQGRAADADTAREAEQRAAAAVSPIDDLRSSADYRRHVVGRLVARWVEQAASLAAAG